MCVFGVRGRVVFPMPTLRLLAALLGVSTANAGTNSFGQQFLHVSNRIQRASTQSE